MTVVEPIRDMRDIKKIESVLKAQCLRDLLLFKFGINSGLRISDILNLNVCDVRNKADVDLYEQKTGKRKKFPLNDQIRSLVKKYTINMDDDEPLFTSCFKNRMTRYTAYEIMNNACETAQLGINIGTHTLRKTFGYHHYKKYKDVALLQRIFNHSSPATTLVYIGIEQSKINDSYLNFNL